MLIGSAPVVGRTDLPMSVRWAGQRVEWFSGAAAVQPVTTVSGCVGRAHGVVVVGQVGPARRWLPATRPSSRPPARRSRDGPRVQATRRHTRSVLSGAVL